MMLMFEVRDSIQMLVLVLMVLLRSYGHDMK